MDRDPSENVIDPVERTSPSTGENDTGENGEQERRKQLDKGENVDGGTIPAQPDKVPLNPD